MADLQLVAALCNKVLHSFKELVVVGCAERVTSCTQEVYTEQYFAIFLSFQNANSSGFSILKFHQYKKLLSKLFWLKQIKQVDTQMLHCCESSLTCECVTLQHVVDASFLVFIVHPAALTCRQTPRQAPGCWVSWSTAPLGTRLCLWKWASRVDPVKTRERGCWAVSAATPSPKNAAQNINETECDRLLILSDVYSTGQRQYI